MNIKIKFSICLAFLFVLMSCGCVDESSKYSNDVSSGGITVYYTDDIPQYTAGKLLDYLVQEWGYGVDADVLFDNVENGQGYEIIFVTVYEMPTDLTESDKYVYQLAATELSQVFGERIVLKAANSDLETLYTTAASY